MAISFVGNLGTTSSTTTSLVITTTGPISVGSTILIPVHTYQTSVPTAATDSKSNTYHLDVHTKYNGQGCALVRGYITTALTTGNTVTITLTKANATYKAAGALLVYTGIKNGTPTTHVSFKSPLSGNTITSTTVSSVSSNSMFFSAIATNATATSYTVSSPFTRRWLYNVSTGKRYIAAADWFPGGITSRKATWTLNASCTNGAILLVNYAAVAATTTKFFSIIG